MRELPIETLVPREGKHIPVPGRRAPLAATGERMRLTTYWQRRLAEGDVTIATPLSEPAPAPVPET